MATREHNLRKAAFCAGILEKSVREIEEHYKMGLRPLAIANLRRRFDDMNCYLEDAIKNANRRRRRSSNSV